MSQKREKKISWNSRSLETALSAWWLLAGAAKFNNLLLQRIQILKALSYLGDEKINRIYPNENYFLSRNLSLQEKKKQNNTFLYSTWKPLQLERPRFTQFLPY